MSYFVPILIASFVTSFVILIQRVITPIATATVGLATAIQVCMISLLVFNHFGLWIEA